MQFFNDICQIFIVVKGQILIKQSGNTGRDKNCVFGVIKEKIFCKKFENELHIKHIIT